MEPEKLTEIAKAIGRRLRIARIAVGAENLTDLSERIGLSGSNVWGNWETRGTLPNALFLMKFIDLYPSLSLDYIYRGDKGKLAYELVGEIEKAEKKLAEEEANPVKRGRPKKSASPLN